MESPARSILSISMSETFENDVLYRLCVDECMAGPLSALTAYTYIHTYIHTYKQTYIHTYIHTYIQTYIHTNIGTSSYIHSKYLIRETNRN
jgi:hypothetical protein